MAGNHWKHLYQSKVQRIPLSVCVNLIHISKQKISYSKQIVKGDTTLNVLPSICSNKMTFRLIPFFIQFVNVDVVVILPNKYFKTWQKKGKYTGSVFTALLAVDLYSPDDSKITVFKVLFFLQSHLQLSTSIFLMATSMF